MHQGSPGSAGMPAGACTVRRPGMNPHNRQHMCVRGAAAAAAAGGQSMDGTLKRQQQWQQKQKRQSGSHDSIL